MTSARFSALGLDIGNRRIGVAGCDGTGLIATGLGVIHRQNYVKDVAALNGWIEQRQAKILVIGLPLLSDGSRGSQAEKVAAFVRVIQQKINLPVEYINEYLSTVQASWDLQSVGIASKQQKHLIDQHAAAVILQEWLDQRRHRTGVAARGVSDSPS
ncbi:MAG: Holliday junction resolvase RuvX [Cyanobacteriota bacterium]|nr:Holliday junction resolvase RuvX [Cyanobacteriota bacterium]